MLREKCFIWQTYLTDYGGCGFDLRLGKELVEQLPHATFIRVDHRRAKTADDPFDFFIGVSGDLADKDLRMIGLVQILAGDLQLLEKFLALSHTGENYIDVLVRRQTREADHVFGECEDLDGLAHVE